MSLSAAREACEQAQAMVADGYLKEAAQQLESANDKIQEYARDKLALEVRLARIQWKASEAKGLLVDAYRAASFVMQNDTSCKMKYVELLLRLRYNREALLVLPLSEWSAQLKERLDASVDSKVLLKRRIFGRIMSYYKGKQSTLLSLCRATAKQIPRLYHLQITSEKVLVLIPIMKCQRVTIDCDGTAEIMGVHLKHPCIKHLTINNHHYYGCFENGFNHKVETLILNSVSCCNMKLSGVKRLISNDSGLKDLKGGLETIEELTIKKNERYDQYYPILKYLTLSDLGYYSHTEDFFNMHARKLEHLSLSYYLNLPKWIPALRLLQNLRVLEITNCSSSKAEAQVKELLQQNNLSISVLIFSE